MSEKVKLIIEIPKYYLKHPQDWTCLAECVRRGIPLDDRENKQALWEMNDRGIWCCPKCKTEVYDGDSDQYCRKCGLDFKYTAHMQKMIKGEDGEYIKKGE